jgi:hypothetical protein
MRAFGWQTKGAFLDNGYAGYKSATALVAPEDGTAMQVGAWVSIGTAPVTARAMIYADNGSGAPGALLGESGDVVIGVGANQNIVFDLASPVALTAGTTYWAAVGFDSGGGTVAVYCVGTGTGAHDYIHDPTASDPYGVATVGSTGGYNAFAVFYDPFATREFPSTGVLDDFNRADGALGANWNNIDPGYPLPVVASDQAACANSTIDPSAYWTTSFAADQEVFVKLGEYPAGDSTVLMVRISGSLPSTTEDGYAVYFDGTSVAIRRSDNGVKTTLATFPMSASELYAGVRVEGSAIFAYVSSDGITWRVAGAAHDTTYAAAGYIGFFSNVPSNTIHHYDDFGGGAIVVPTAESDVMRRNPMTYTGKPILVPSMLVRDFDDAIAFPVGSSFTIPHSSSLNLLNGAVGGIGVSFQLNIPAYPLAEAKLFEKAGEYWASILPDGTLRFYLTSGHVDSSAPIPLNTDVDVLLVYNGGYSGATTFGHTTQGATLISMQGDYRAGSLTGAQNLQVCRYQLLEKALVHTIWLDTKREDGTPTIQDVAAVAYADAADFTTAAKLDQSAAAVLGDFVNGSRPRIWAPFPVNFVHDAGFLYLGYAGGALHASDPTIIAIGADNTGGTRKTKNAVVSASSGGPASQPMPSPFGAVGAADAVNLAVYGEYTPLSRTGDEGNLLIYLDGQEDARAAYASGITPGTSPLTGPELPAYMDELILWNRKLSAIEAAQLHAAR